MSNHAAGADMRVGRHDHLDHVLREIDHGARTAGIVTTGVAIIVGVVGVVGEQARLILEQPETAPPRWRGPINGLVHVDRHCCRSCTLAAVVQRKVGSHSGVLKCPDCGRFRQWLPKKVSQFLIELIVHFGRLQQPIELCECANRPAKPLSSFGAHVAPRRYHRQR